MNLEQCTDCNRPLQNNILAEISGRCDRCRELIRELADNGERWNTVRVPIRYRRSWTSLWLRRIPVYGTCYYRVRTAGPDEGTLAVGILREIDNV